MAVARIMAFATMVSVCSAALLVSRSAGAFELSGAWATNVEKCKKVFARKGRARAVGFTSFSRDSGFIAEVDRIRGKHENCMIKSRKDVGQTINLIVACASGIMLSDVQFLLKVIDDNTISREFPGMDGMDVKYHRCQV